MKKSISILLMAIPSLVLLGWLGMLYFPYISAPKVTIAVSGYDPRDLLSGHYLNLRLNWDKTDCKQFADNVCPKERFKENYRYYLPAEEAKTAEKDIFEQGTNAFLEFSFPAKSEPLIKNFYIKKSPL